MKVLGIESSCDETGVALYDSEKGLLADALHSQVALHRRYGGVVPELASRDHIRRTLPLIDEVMSRAACTPDEVDGLAYTAGPGLTGALLVGASIGRSLALAWDIPAIAVHHMEGHLLAPLLAPDPPQYPYVALLVSGGHTQLVAVSGIGEYRMLGESLDDAAGEAFDKVAKMLALPYPGGPQVASLAEQGQPGRFTFPRPMVNRPGLDFSFSGLKTYTLNTLAEHTAAGEADQQLKADIAHAFQEAVVGTLLVKCRRALRETGLQTLVVAGGVSANQRLREALDAMMIDEFRGQGRVHYPPLQYCTDNGAMIALAGCQRLMAGQQDDLRIQARPRWSLDSLPPLTNS